MEQKTVEQIAHDHAMKSDAGQQETAKYSFISGYTTAQQSQPMWREIEPTLYYPTRYMRNKDSAILRSGSGWELLRDGYTHYLSSEDLLKLPTLTKTTPQERG